MHDRDTALLARSAAALRAQGRLEAADQLDEAVRERHVASPGSTAADLDGIRRGTFVLRDDDPTSADDDVA